jgi:hypothetical protein
MHIRHGAYCGSALRSPLNATATQPTAPIKLAICALLTNARTIFY